MPAVLGIDAAWTDTEPSGVALVVNQGAAWRLVAATASYRDFHVHAGGGQRPERCSSDLRPDPSALLASCSTLCALPVEIVAIDIPLSRGPIIGRRTSDNAVSRVYGARKCGTHSPSITRPGSISTELRDGFAQAGYPLQTVSISTPGLIEVYPHPALVELTRAPERLRYKASKARSYWPHSDPAERRKLLFDEWDRIVTLLEELIKGTARIMPLPAIGARSVELKAFEDKLDALICAWVAICALERRIKPYGNYESAIWIPSW